MLQFLTDHSIYVCAIFSFPSYILHIVGPLSKFLLLKITQIWVITICVVLNHSTVIFQKEWGVHIKKSLVDRNKYLTLNRCSLGNYEYYMLFSYQTGYIMWHSRLMIYIPIPVSIKLTNSVIIQMIWKWCLWCYKMLFV